MSGYYAQKLSGERLRRCYEIAPARVRQYLEAELDHVISRVPRAGTVLDLGCGYGRIARRLAAVAGRVVGIDNAPASIALARQLHGAPDRCEFLAMDAVDLGFADGAFDAVLCLQNGICAFHVDQGRLVREALRVTRPGGIVLLSSYSDRFWPDRLAWFEIQAAEGLIGSIDRRASGDGVIACEDGFSVGRMTPEDFRFLCAQTGCDASISEVDASCVFCEIVKPGDGRSRPAAPAHAERSVPASGGVQEARMICRMWHGRTLRSRADAYQAFLLARALPDYRSVRGNIDAAVLRRDEGEITHFITRTHWESEESIRAFAGDDLLKAKYYPEDTEYLLEFEPEVVHYAIVGAAGASPAPGP